MTEAVASSAGGSSAALLMGLGAVIALIVLALRYIQTSSDVSKVTDSKNKDSSSGDGKKKKPVDNRVQLNPQADAAYVANCLRPDAKPLDILYAICTSPDNVAVTSKHLALRAELVEKKLAHLKKEAEEKAAGPSANMDDLFDDDGWAEDDENDEAALKAKKAKEEKERQAKELAKATGKDMTDVTKVKLEGIDENILGEEWVRSHLTELGSWPPPSLSSSPIAKRKYKLDDGSIVGPLDHPAVARNLLMTMGRLNARDLNTHPELREAGPAGRIDPTYFQQTMEYRQRVGQVLEGAMRMACTLRSYDLACAIIDAMVMFKIGLVDVDDEKQLAWFKDLMAKQYGPAGTPNLDVGEKYLGVPVPSPEPTKEDGTPKTESEMREEAKNRTARMVMQTKAVTTTDEKMALEMQITRTHAEAFTKAKIAQCQQQGIPPQLAMQAYRESWFILIRARKVSDDGTTDGTWDGVLNVRDSDGKLHTANHMDQLRESKSNLYEMLEPATASLFSKEFDWGKNPKDLPDKKIVVGYPFAIANVAQKTGRVKIHVPPPTTPGRYEFSVTIKSQDFLGLRYDFALPVDIEKGDEKAVENKKDK